MALKGIWSVLYYGIFASLTGGWLPVRTKNLWLVIFHLYLFLTFIIFPLTVYLVSCWLLKSHVCHVTHSHTHNTCFFSGKGYSETSRLLYMYPFSHPLPPPLSKFLTLFTDFPTILCKVRQKERVWSAEEMGLVTGYPTS